MAAVHASRVAVEAGIQGAIVPMVLRSHFGGATAWCSVVAPSVSNTVNVVNVLRTFLVHKGHTRSRDWIVATKGSP